MKDLQRESWKNVLEAMSLVNARLVPKETARWLMEEHFAAEELLLRELHPELMK